MKLSTSDQFAASAALASVQTAASDLAAVHDTEDAKRKLLAVRHAAMTAYATIADAEVRARSAALAQLETAA